LFWIFNQHPAYLIIAQIFSGFIWAGFNLCTTNFIYDAASPGKRTRCIAYFNTLNGIALCCGALGGAFLLPLVPNFFGYPLLTLFAISAGLRFIIGISLPRLLKEVRPVEHVKSDQLFFSMIGIRPLIGVERKTVRY
jgi:MFS family permease